MVAGAAAADGVEAPGCAVPGPDLGGEDERGLLRPGGAPRADGGGGQPVAGRAVVGGEVGQDVTLLLPLGMVLAMLLLPLGG